MKLTFTKNNNNVLQCISNITQYYTVRVAHTCGIMSSLFNSQHMQHKTRTSPCNSIRQSSVFIHMTHTIYLLALYCVPATSFHY